MIGVIFVLEVVWIAFLVLIVRDQLLDLAQGLHGERVGPAMIRVVSLHKNLGDNVVPLHTNQDDNDS
jgi:hypothetical protein